MKKSISLILVYLFFITIGGVFIGVFLYSINDDGMFVASFGNLIMYLLLNAIGFYILKDEIKTDFENYKKKNNKFFEIIKGYLILLALGFIGNYILMIIGYYNTTINQQVIEELMQSKYMIIIIITVLLGPIIEELVFRKSFFNLFVKRWEFSPILTLIISSILFASIHVIFNIEDNLLELLLMIPYFIQGLALGYLYIKSDYNIFLPLNVHIFSNLISVIIILIT